MVRETSPVATETLTYCLGRQRKCLCWRSSTPALATALTALPDVRDDLVSRLASVWFA